MSKIATHVLDTTLGKPAEGIAVRLERREPGGSWFEVTTDGEAGERVREAPVWEEVSSSVTDADGRCRDLIDDAPEGQYRLIFDTGAYLREMNRTGIYPEVSVTFHCDGEASYHLPLLLCENSYTTYRGS